MKVKELIQAVDDNYEELLSLFHLEDVIENLPKCVARHIERDKHRWYSIATNVYECEDGFVGITGAAESFSECQGWDDIGVHCTAREYEAVSIITYKEKKQ